MADVDGQIVLGLDIAQTTDQMSRDLDRVLKNIGKKEIALGVKIDTDIKQQLDNIKSKNIDVKVNGEQATRTIQGIEKNIVSANKQTKTFGDTIRNALNIGSAAAVTVKAIQLIRNAAKEAVEAVKDFDSAITDLRTATGESYETVKKWVEGYNQMGQALGATTSEVADSANTWLRQGRTAAEANSLIETTMVLSKVGMLDSADAAEYLTSAMKGYQVAVEDVASIVDKLTSVDANAAVSAGDLAEAMSQTAVTAANAGVSMDKLLGYLAAVGEVTQKDMSSIGNAFKTIFTRMSDIKSGKLELIDEDGTTEILSDVETVLNGLNIKLRESDNEFRNFGDVIDEVAAKWDTYSDVQQAAIAKAFAGTRQQENFRVLMANYDKASKYMDIAADSAGAAEKKFSAYLDSIEAKTKSLQAAFESLAVNTFSTEMFGGIIDATAELVKFIDKTNLVKGSLIALGAAGVIKCFTVIATGISNAAIKLNEFNAALKMVKVGNLGENEIAQLVKVTSNLSQSQLKAVLSSKALSAEQRIAILTSSGMTDAEAAQTLATMGLATAEGTATTATFSLSGAVKGLWATLMANPLTLVIAAITAVVSIYSTYKQKMEEARQASLDAGEAAKDEAKNLKELYAAYQRANSAYKSNVGSKEDLESATDDLLAALGCERAEIEKLVEEYGNLDAAIDSVTRKSLEDSASKILSAYEAAKTEALKDASDSMGWFSGSSITVKTSGDAKKFAEALQEAGYLGSGNLPALSTSMYTGINDYGDFDSLIEGYEKLLEIKKALESGIGTKYTAEELSQADVYVDIADKINAVADAIGNVNSYVKEYNDIQAELSYMDYVEANGIPETQEQYEALKQSMLDTADASGRFLGSQDEIESSIVNILATMPALQDFVDVSGDAAEGISTYKAELTDVLSDLQSAYDILETAQEEMAGGGGLSADTIADLAEAEANYLDYLYEENGVIKLNTDAWKENANAKILSDIDEIQKEINSLEDRNDVLEKSLELYRTNKSMSMGDTTSLEAWDKKIKETTDEISANTNAISENQAKLALYSSLYGNITGDTNAYTAALSNFTNVANTIDSVSGSFQTLADLQAQVANGFTMSLDKALEFAAVYPEILNSAQVTANGQISLNEGVVNSFIEGKKAELDAQVDAEIAKLEADKAVLTAKMEFTEAELELAKSVADGEGDITKELAEYRINAGNAVAQALIDAGIDEATAFKLAAAAMAQNAEEFDRVAMEVCTDVNGNFNQAAYDLAQTMYKNLTNVKTDLASVATQAHETAKAIAGIADGSVVGSSGVVGGSGGGTGSSGIKLNLTSGSFEGTEYTYTAKESGLEDFISQIELDISNYQNAITQIDGQIATLQALKNLPLKSFKSGSGSSSGSSSATNEVEEYIASIDDYREAIERLNRIQIKRTDLETKLSNTDDLRTQIELQEELIGVYQEEQDALHDLNELRDQTIKEGTESLRQLGFDVEYDPDSNLFFVKNLEHLNELVADSTGEYGSLQEATNALRQDTENLINTLGDLNTANQENSESWWELAQAMKEARIAIYENTVKEHENGITLNENWLNNSIKSHDYDGITKYTSEIINHYREMQETIHQQAEYYRSLGYADTSDEVSKLLDLWWDYYDEIAEASANAWQQVVDNANDAVDEITGLYDTLKDAAQEYADSGFITIDTLQEICSWGVQYLAYLKDENGQLVINEESIQSVIAARTEQMAVETALSYVAQIRSAIERNEINELMNLTLATETTTSATWDLVYAQLKLLNVSGDLNDTMYAGALQNINNLRALSGIAISSIGKVEGSIKEANEAAKSALEDQADALDDLLKYVEEMIKQEVKNQVQALEDQVDKMKEIVDLQKKSLQLEKEKDDYTKTIAEKTKELAKLQQQLALLELDDSRESLAQQAKLREEIADLANDLADEQADHAYDATCDMLDDMADAYEKEKQQEIDVLENSISSEEKLFRLAIERIETQWDSLYRQLIDWNTEYGTVTNKEITSAWDAACIAVEKYGSYLEAVLQIQQQIAALEASSSSSSSSTVIGSGVAGTTTTPNVVGNSGNYDTSGGQETENVHNIIKKMYANSQAWGKVSESEQNRLDAENLQLGQSLARYGINAYRDNGTWYTSDGSLLYDKYKMYIYHTGGVVGDDPTLKQNEMFAKLKKGEAVLTEKQQEVVDKALDLSGFVPVPTEETMLGKYGALFGAVKSSDSLGSKMQSQIQKDAQQLQSVVSHGGDTFDIDVPVQIYPAQKLDENDIKFLTKKISSFTIRELDDVFALRGMRSFRR